MKGLALLAAVAAMLSGALFGVRALAAGPSPLIEHIVAPAATDSSQPIDSTLADHYAWFNPDKTLSNKQLLVYLPGNSGEPANALIYQQLAAQLGYHVIGLMYETGYFLAELCNTDPNANLCFYEAHYEVTYGFDTSPKLQVSQADSIVNLLTTFLHYLSNKYPAEGWSQFLTAAGEPVWTQITMSGISQGAGNSAMVARDHVVSRVVMFSGVTDAIPTDSVSWLSTHLTPSNRYWGLAHDQDPGYVHITANWISLGVGYPHRHTKGLTGCIPISSPTRGRDISTRIPRR
jgi:hypothetical protein